MTDQDGITHPPAEIVQCEEARLYPEHWAIISIVAVAFVGAVVGLVK